ncbi:hypothetical protein FQN54_001721 [Arachnomyces sp. PD_36]|nr:hypothetical protein FQN54_001721 [Arachnomyces sp. PD_36]
MVTQIGDAGYPSTDGDEVGRRTRNRQRPVLPPLIETSRTVPSSPTHTPSPNRRDAPRTHANTPQPSPLTYQRPDPELFLPTEPSPLINDNGNAPVARPPFRSPTFSVNDQNNNTTPNTSTDEAVEHPAPLGPRPARPPLRTSMSSPQLNPRRPSHYRPYHPYQSDTSPRGLALPRFPQSPSGLRTGEKGRSSAQSALTSCSSIEQTSGTERSSVLTKASSITDSSPDTPDVAYGDDGGMSVDDAIAMYLDGFTDDPPEEEEDVNGIGKGEVHAHDGADQVSAAQQVDGSYENIASKGDQTGPSTLNNHAPTTTPAPTFSATSALPGTGPPPITVDTPVRDRYGFKKATSHIDVATYDSWNKQYSEYLKHRKLKWVELMRETGQSLTQPTDFPVRSNKMRRYVKKGIPPEYRGAAWFWYSGGYVHLQRNPGLYNKLVEQALASPSNDDKEHIERDLHRTFPDNIHFKPDQPAPATNSATPGQGSSNPKYCSNHPETPIIHSLRRVLYAFSLHNTKVGYTQSLNFIAGLLLLFLPEEKAFWMLHVVTSEFLPGTHEISLEGANVDLWILMVVLKESLPAIYTKVASTTPTTSRSKPPTLTITTRLPDITLGLTHWLMSMFIGSLPFETTLRVWDIFFYEGSKTFFTAALAIFKTSEKEIAAVSDPMEVFQIVQTVPKKLIDANMFSEDCFSRKFRLRQNRVDELRAARRKIVREEKVRVSMLHVNGKTQTDIGSRTMRNPTSPLPGMVDSWRNLKHHAFK